ncbi:MAG TPA: GNAT family N-acetyltransferase [Gemmatimonadales bacterium]|jgi:GNAT superfamily N-acetyltransferase|nr:GNAT family N-acetyltransferase [Gemmatimonadales bacterium]
MHPQRSLTVREIRPDEFDLVWPVFHAVISSGDTYAYSPHLTIDEARTTWTAPPARAFLAELDGTVVATYTLRPNQPGLGNHVANAGYMVAPGARGQGIAGTLCEHSIETARGAGFTAMQFNFVVSSNEGAVRLWQRCGFSIVGQVPAAFRHSERGLTDVFIMHRFLSP